MNIGEIIRWIARISSLVSLVLLGMFFFGGQEDQQFANSPEMVGFLFVSIERRNRIFAQLEMGICRFDRFSLVGLFGFYCWHFLRSGEWPVGPWFLIFTSPAVVFLIAAILTTDRAKE